MIFAGALLFFELLFFFLQMFAISAAAPHTLYTSAVGYLILISRCVLGVLFALLGAQSTFSETGGEKRLFYMIFTAFFVVWFFALPVLNILFSGRELWHRMEAVMPIYVTGVWIGYAAFVVMMWPSRAARFFEVAAPDGMFEKKRILKI